MKLNDFFDKIYCINLDRRPDRWKECELEFQKHNLSVERIPAIDGNPDNLSMKMKMPHQENKPGIIGCNLSHLKVFKKALQDGANTFLVLEDDIVFCDDLETQFEKCHKQLPDDWKMIYFGGSHRGEKNVKQITENVYQITHTFTTHCQGMKKEMLQHAIDTMSQLGQPADWFYADWQKVFKTYAFVPHLAWQRASYSDIEKAHVDYSTIIKNFKIH